MSCILELKKLHGVVFGNDYGPTREELYMIAEDNFDLEEGGLKNQLNSIRDKEQSQRS